MSQYSDKKALQKSGGYNGPSPFFTNLAEFQHIKPLDSYPHLRELPNFRIGVPFRDKPVTFTRKPIVEKVLEEILEIDNTFEPLEDL